MLNKYYDKRKNIKEKDVKKVNFVTKKDIIENFNKVYNSSDNEVYVFKAAHCLDLFGGTDLAVSRISMGITPTTYIATAPSGDERFYLSFADSNVRYECAKEELAIYSRGDKAENIFKKIAPFCEKISGARIYLFCECEDEEEYEQAAVLAFCTLCGENPAEYERKLYINKKISFFEYAKGETVFLSEKNRCTIIDGDRISLYSLPCGGYKAVIIKINKKTPRGKAWDDNSAEYAIKEKKALSDAENALKKGDFCCFGNIIKQISNEYLKASNKRKTAVMSLFELVSGMSALCGIYNDCGIYAFVSEEEVDGFIKSISASHEKIIGKKPQFYVCTSERSCML